MISNRRSFLKKQFILGGSVMLGSSLNSLATISKNIAETNGSQSLNLLCTSDLAKLNNYRQSINNFELSTINLFAGNISNATETTLQQLGCINYHAVNFSLDKQGVNLAAMLPDLNRTAINFVNCNYQFESKAMQQIVLPYLTLFSGNKKIGITGLGAYSNTKGLTVNEPIAALNKIAKHLKNNMNCEKVICLADFGFDTNEKLNNLVLAQASEYVDAIVGAGANPKNNTAWSYKNAMKQEVLVLANKKDKRFTNITQITLNQNKHLFNLKNI